MFCEESAGGRGGGSCHGNFVVQYACISAKHSMPKTVVVSPEAVGRTATLDCNFGTPYRDTWSRDKRLRVSSGSLSFESVGVGAVTSLEKLALAGHQSI